jgi:hypothetical protein
LKKAGVFVCNYSLPGSVLYCCISILKCTFTDVYAEQENCKIENVTIGSSRLKDFIKRVNQTTI